MSNYIGMSTEREKKRHLRAEIAAWQKASIGVLILSVLVNCTQFYVIKHNHQMGKAWETKYNAAVAIERDAVQAYGELLRQVEQERQARAEQAKAYEAIGDYVYLGTFTITSYCPCELCCGDWADGITATGLPAVPGIVAVDETIIPLGSTVIIDGQKYLAADAGGAIKGDRVDIFYTSHDEAIAFGVQSAEVWVVAV